MNMTKRDKFVPCLSAGRAFRGSALAPFLLRKNGCAAPTIRRLRAVLLKEIYIRSTLTRRGNP